jgi:hypothetical protein
VIGATCNFLLHLATRVVVFVQSDYYELRSFEASRREGSFNVKRYAHLSMALTISLGAGLAAAADPLPQDAFTSKATGAITISTGRHSPLFAEFERSPTLTTRLVAALSASGFEVTSDKAAAKATLIIRGDMALLGGPVFYKGVKVAIGDATERALAAASGEVNRAEVVQTAAAVALNNAALESAITPFWRGMAISGLASTLGEASGMKAGFNRALTGDPRGICLSRCEDWNKVNQSAYVWVAFQSGDRWQEVRVLTRVRADALMVEQLLDRALGDALTAIAIEPGPRSSPK